jgi:hypothetical protein
MKRRSSIPACGMMRGRSVATAERLELMRALAHDDRRVIAQALRSNPEPWFLRDLADLLEKRTLHRTYKARILNKMVANYVWAEKRRNPERSLNKIVEVAAQRLEVSEKTVWNAMTRYPWPSNWPPMGS